MLNAGKFRAFSLRSGTRKRLLLSIVPAIQTYTESFTCTTRKGVNKQGSHIVKEKDKLCSFSNVITVNIGI